MENIIQDKLYFKKIAELNGIEVNNTQLDQMEAYVNLLLQKNNVVNLISRKDIDNIWENHIIHSVSIILNVSFPRKALILDLGTGGGLPGIPIKILLPEINLTLVDSIKKKINAINEFISKLELKNTSAIWSRVENLNKEHVNHYDIILSRAVAPLKDLIKWSYPFVKKYSTSNISSTLVVLKGGDLVNELKQAQLYGKYREMIIKDIFVAGTSSKALRDKKVIIVNF